MKVFLDTNVLISAYTARGICADLLRYILSEHELLTGEVNLAELRRVLRDRFKAPQATIATIETGLRDETIVAKPKKPSPLPIRDPDDRWVLASAVEGGADLLVTGDQDLLQRLHRRVLQGSRRLCGQDRRTGRSRGEEMNEFSPSLTSGRRVTGNCAKDWRIQPTAYPWTHGEFAFSPLEESFAALMQIKALPRGNGFSYQRTRTPDTHQPHKPNQL